jgi:hypothetical protein
VYLDGQYQKGFSGTFKGLSKGDHKITVTGATKDHDLVTATHTIIVEVEEGQESARVILRCEAADSKKPEAYSLEYEYAEDFFGPRTTQIVCGRTALLGQPSRTKHPQGHQGL